MPRIFVMLDLHVRSYDEAGDDPMQRNGIRNAEAASADAS